MSVCSNLTGRGDDGQEQQPETTLSIVINQWLIPGTCAFGVVGNLLNLAILRRRQLQRSFRTLEQGANFCLVCLAVSDLMFCALALLTLLLPSDNTYSTKGFALLYGLYNAAIINVFIMESTLLIVAMSLERYLAICFPLRLNIYLTSRRIKYVVSLTIIFSVCFNIPVLWRKKDVGLCAGQLVNHILSPSNVTRSGIYSKPEMNSELLEDVVNRTFNADSNAFEMLTVSANLLENITRLSSSSSSSNKQSSVNISQPPSSVTVSLLPTHSSLSTKSSSTTAHADTAYTLKTVLLGDSYVYDTFYRILWAIFGNIIPLILLIYFNVCLCRQIYCSFKLQKQLGRQRHTRNSSNSLTLTLVAIVVLFFILVAPSEVTLLAIHIFDIQETPSAQMIEAILNLMQSINFSVNFILYCIINPYFRKTFKQMFFCGRCWLPRTKREWTIQLQSSFT